MLEKVVANILKKFVGPFVKVCASQILVPGAEPITDPAPTESPCVVVLGGTELRPVTVGHWNPVWWRPSGEARAQPKRTRVSEASD